MSLKNRINRLERDHGGGDELPILAVQQDLDDRMLFHNDIKGITVRRDSPEFAELASKYQLITVVYVDDWRADDEPGDVVHLTWPEDD